MKLHELTNHIITFFVLPDDVISFDGLLLYNRLQEDTLEYRDLYNLVQEYNILWEGSGDYKPDYGTIVNLVRTESINKGTTFFVNILEIPSKERNVHTEHCCFAHGCKYNEQDCPVVNMQQLQSAHCEQCGKSEKFVLKTLEDFYADAEIRKYESQIKTLNEEIASLTDSRVRVQLLLEEARRVRCQSKTQS